MVQGMNCGTKDERNSVCEACIMGKQHRTAYPRGVSTRATKAFEIIHSDVCGPMSVNSVGGSRYFVTFIDDYSSYTRVYFIKHKDEVLEKFKEFVNLTANITGKQVKTLRSDNGGEYCSKSFDAYLKEKGIVHQTTVPYNPAQNGVAERMNRTIVEAARSMMSHSKMPMEFWAEAVNTAVYLRNRSPTTSLKDITPYECLFNRKPDASNLKVFGCLAFAHIPENQRKKFEEKSRKAVSVGYPEGTKGYRLYDLSTSRFIRSRDVFAEEKFRDFDNGYSLKSDSHFYYPVGDGSEAVQDVQVVAPDEEDDGNTDDGQTEPDNDVAPIHHNQPVGATYEEKGGGGIGSPKTAQTSCQIR